MDIKILEIASDTKNVKNISNFTHTSKRKNNLCGDEVCIELIIKKNFIKDFGYGCKSCVYCQASASILANSINLEVHAGHGIDYKTAKILSKIKEIKEFNIGHFIIGESVNYGLKKTIKKFKNLLR